MLTPGFKEFVDNKSHPLNWFNLNAINYSLKVHDDHTESPLLI